MKYTKCAVHSFCVCNIARAFAMTTLAMIASKPRDQLESLITHAGASLEPMPPETAARLRENIVSGAVTSIVSNPEPLLFMKLNGSYGTLRAVYGVWLERKASFYGVPQKPLPRLGMKTAEEAGLADLVMPVED